MLVVRRTACCGLRAKTAAARETRIPIPTRAVCCSYYRWGPSPSKASRADARPPIFRNIFTTALSSTFAADDAPRRGRATPAGGVRAGQAREKSTAALIEENDNDVGREAMVDIEASGGGSLTSFRLTDIGEGIMEVEVLQWFVSPGDRVSQFDKLCEVQSDKANVEITSRYDGVVRKIHWDVGDMVQTGSVLVEIEEPPATTNDAGGSPPVQAFLSSADKTGVPELSIPRSAKEAAAMVSVPASASAEIGLARKGEAGLDGESDVHGHGVGGGRAARRQVLATPAVRRLCREMSIDLSIEPISGTGLGGRVLKGDVLAHAAKETETSHDIAQSSVGAAADEVAGKQPQEAGQHDLSDLLGLAKTPEMVFHEDTDGLGSLSEPALESASTSASDWSSGSSGDDRRAPTTIDRGEEIGAAGVQVVEGEGQWTRPDKEARRPSGLRERKEPVSVPIKGVQRAMMEAMQRALEVPHMTFCDEVHADRLGQLRSDLKEAAERRGVRLSYLPLIVKATSMALTAFPTLNASLSEDKTCLLQHPSHNIGVAMDTAKGLLVPCIPAVEEMSVLDIAEELNTLQKLGTAGKLGEAELTGTTFTLSNIGSIGGTYASPVLLHPQVCIGALGRMQRVPRFDPMDTDKVVAARVFPVSWSADHRVVDGGTLARFSNTWKAYLQNPALMLADAR
eukprot:g6428.t1